MRIVTQSLRNLLLAVCTIVVSIAVLLGPNESLAQRAVLDVYDVSAYGTELVLV